MALDRPISLVEEPRGGDLLGRILVAQGLLTEAQVEQALAIQNQTHARLGEILLDSKLVPERELMRVLGEQLGVKTVDLRLARSEEEALALVPEAYASQHLVLPLTLGADGLTVAAADPLNLPLLAELRVMTRTDVTAWLAPPSELRGAIQQRYKVLPGVAEFVRAFEKQDQPVAAFTPEMALLAENAPVVQIVNLLITQGLRDRASDIHIEPKKDRIRIRFRIDGVLADVLTLPLPLSAGIASRLKIMAELDIVERHRSQDGQIQMDVDGHQVDIRVATVETIWGEKIVLRLLDKERTILALHELGVESGQYDDLSRLLKSPFGMIVVSGPTGSGKTTTLYAAVSELDGVGRNLMTIEDPVEYTFENLNQVQIRKMANITFANGLKAILRQDPDVILVGEIRDTETAEIAIQSALTGHLVLSSLHAIDAPGVLQRLMDMRIEGFLISSSVVGVVAQRLMRRICEHCRTPHEPTFEELTLHNQLSQMNQGAPVPTAPVSETPAPSISLPGQRTKPNIRPSAPQFFKGTGCNHCAGTGYHGRLGVFEVLNMTDGVRRLIADRATQREIRDQAVSDGMVTMRQDAVAKVDLGITTMAELIRSVYLQS
jgi:type IV pilus assembly protein PilB